MTEKRVQRLDHSITVYGNTGHDGTVRATGMGECGLDVAMAKEARSGCENLTVYYHPDDGWTDVVTDEPV